MTAARGMSVAQRFAVAAPGDGVLLRVGDVRAVEVPGRAAMESRTKDDIVWRRHWSEPERLVMDFIGVTVVEVADATGTVTFDRQLGDETEQHLLFDHVLPLVLARSGELVLHGGVISLGDSAVVLIGQSGAGKSTLTAFACQQGWTVGGDDGAVIGTDAGVTVEPTYASIRLTPFSVDLLGLDALGTSPVVGKLRVAGPGAAAFRQDPMPLSLVAFVEPVGGGELAEFTELGGVQAHARLFGSTFHADLAADRGLQATMDRLATVIGSVQIGVLTVPRGLEGLHAAEAVLRRQLAELGSGR